MESVSIRPSLATVTRVMDLNSDHPATGENWMPDIMAFQRREEDIAIRSETINHRNSGMVAVAPDGLHISVRALGRVVGASVSIGDGGGEMNKIITCAWILTAKGLNTDPIVQQLMDGLAGSDIVHPGDVKNSQQELKAVVDEDSLDDCFAVFEGANPREKLVFGAGLGSWDRSILTIEIGGHEKPSVVLA